MSSVCRTIDRQRSLLAQPPSSLYDELRVVRTREEIESSNIARQASVAEIAKKVAAAVFLSCYGKGVCNIGLRRVLLLLYKAGCGGNIVWVQWSEVVNRTFKMLINIDSALGYLIHVSLQAGMTKSNVQNVLNRLKNTVSLDAPVANVETNNDEDRTLADNLVGAQGEETGEGLGGYLRMWVMVPSHTRLERY